MLEQSEHSAMPDGEWPALVEALRDDLLDTAERLHVLALIVADLRGAYNEYGIRRWFTRPRARLDGRAPRDLLPRGWDPDGPDALRVRALAAGLVGAGVA